MRSAVEHDVTLLEEASVDDDAVARRPAERRHGPELELRIRRHEICLLQHRDRLRAGSRSELQHAQVRRGGDDRADEPPESSVRAITVFATTCGSTPSTRASLDAVGGAPVLEKLELDAFRSEGVDEVLRRRSERNGRRDIAIALVPRHDARRLARIEDRLVTVLPAHGVMRVIRRPEHVQDLAEPSRIADAPTAHGDDVASLNRRLSGRGHGASLFVAGAQTIRPPASRDHRFEHRSWYGELPRRDLPRRRRGPADRPVRLSPMVGKRHTRELGAAAPGWDAGNGARASPLEPERRLFADLQSRPDGLSEPRSRAPLVHYGPNEHLSAVAASAGWRDVGKAADAPARAAALVAAAALAWACRDPGSSRRRDRRS